MQMQHENVMDTDMEINRYGLKYGLYSPGYRAVKKAAIELAVEKMSGVGNAINRHHKKGPQKTTKSR
jgi:hypothetical protein